MPHLVISEPGRVPFPLPLMGAIRIGRGSDNELVVADRQASRQHAVIAPEPDGWAVIDQGSRHGTLINGAPTERALLRDGDVVQIGATTLTFVVAAPSVQLLHSIATALDPPPIGGRDRVFGELATAIARLDDTEAMAAALLGAIVAATGTERGVLALAAPRGRPRAAAELGVGLVLPAEHVAEILERGHAVIVRGDGRAAMGAPIRGGERVLGLIYVDDRDRADRFGTDDLVLLTRLGRLAATALGAAERQQRTEALVTLAPAVAVTTLQGACAAIVAVRDDIDRYGPAEVAVLIGGETGTGKELVARALHAASPRRAGPFVALNCGALPAALVEAELFGHVRGAFTGAGQDRRGRLALAHGGTLFLDEVADLGPAGQAALLRVLEDGEVTPLGGERPLHVDLRVIAATHKRIAGEIAAGRFREDLYYRLAVVELTVPPLRERGDDLLILAESLRAAAAERHRRPITGFTSAARACLVGHRWPGNVRELRHEIERAVLVATGPELDVADLGPRLRDPGRALPPPPTLAARFAGLDGQERGLLEEALAETRGNVAAAARVLGITRIMLKRRLDRMAISGPDEQEDR